MKIYFTDCSGLRQLVECNLFELNVPGKAADDGKTQNPVYKIFNKSFDECLAIAFGGETHIGQHMRDGFWTGVSNALKLNFNIFDVDDWFNKIKFVTAEEKAALEKMRKKMK